MTSDHLVSPSPLPTAHTNITSKSTSIISVKEPSRNLYNISYLLKRMRGKRTSEDSISLTAEQKSSKMTSWLPVTALQQQTTYHEALVHKQKSLINNTIPLINTPIHEHNKLSQFPRDRLNKNRKKFDTTQKPSTKYFRSEKYEKQQFNNTTYCVAYCTIIIIGVTIGGWIGGLFELITGDHNGCTNKYQGNDMCRRKYSTLNVTTHCINIFYTNSILNNLPYICLCRFRNNSQGKYRDCEFLHAKIRYI